MSTAFATDIAVCPCQHCNGRIQFERERSGEIADCPLCGLETPLFVPDTSAAPVPPRSSMRSRRKYFLAAAVVGLLVLGGFAWLIYLNAARVLAITGGLFGAIVGVILLTLLVIWAVLWIVFPVFVYFGLNRLEKILRQIEINTRHKPDG